GRLLARSATTAFRLNRQAVLLVVAGSPARYGQVRAVDTRRTTRNTLARERESAYTPARLSGCRCRQKILRGAHAESISCARPDTRSIPGSGTPNDRGVWHSCQTAGGLCRHGALHGCPRPVRR